jgi:predicted nucleic acid-binding protein
VSLPVVVVDTNVWGADLDARTKPLRARYARHLVGVLPAISAQTVAELRYGALKANWGRRRMDELDRLLRRAHVIDVDDHLIWTHARLRTTCRRVGHPLHDKSHNGDLWIAASAVAHDLPLVTDDQLFEGVPGLRVITEPV